VSCIVSTFVSVVEAAFKGKGGVFHRNPDVCLVDGGWTQMGSQAVSCAPEIPPHDLMKEDYCSSS